MARVYSDAELQARVAALANVHNFQDAQRLFAADHPQVNKGDAWMAMQPTAPQRDYRRNNPNGKVMTSKYNGRCVDCQGYISAGTTIRYDGKAHHYPACPQSDKADPMEGWNEQTQTWGDTDPMGSWDSNADDFRSAPKAQAQAQVVEAPTAPTAELPDGKLTVQYSDGHHRTFKIHTQSDKAKFAPGKRVIKYLAKSDNQDENSYVGFAFYVAGRVQVWSRFQNSELAKEAQVLNDVEEARAAGKAYAMASGNCARCGHDLTDPTSIEAGYGPDCRKILGI